MSGLPSLARSGSNSRNNTINKPFKRTTRFVSNDTDIIPQLESERDEYVKYANHLMRETDSILNSNEILQNELNATLSKYVELQKYIANIQEERNNTIKKKDSSYRRLKKYQESYENSLDKDYQQDLKVKIDQSRKQLDEMLEKYNSLENKYKKEQEVVQLIIDYNFASKDLIKMNKELTDEVWRLLGLLEQNKSFLTTSHKQFLYNIRLQVQKNEQNNKNVIEDNTANNESEADPFAELDKQLAQLEPVFQDFHDVLTNPSRVQSGMTSSLLFSETSSSNFESDTLRSPSKQNQEKLITYIRAPSNSGNNTPHRATSSRKYFENLSSQTNNSSVSSKAPIDLNGEELSSASIADEYSPRRKNQRSTPTTPKRPSAIIRQPLKQKPSTPRRSRSKSQKNLGDLEIQMESADACPKSPYKVQLLMDADDFRKFESSRPVKEPRIPIDKTELARRMRNEEETKKKQSEDKQKQDNDEEETKRKIQEAIKRAEEQEKIEKENEKKKLEEERIRIALEEERAKNAAEQERIRKEIEEKQKKQKEKLKEAEELKKKQKEKLEEEEKQKKLEEEIKKKELEEQKLKEKEEEKARKLIEEEELKKKQDEEMKQKEEEKKLKEAEEIKNKQEEEEKKRKLEEEIKKKQEEERKLKELEEEKKAKKLEEERKQKEKLEEEEKQMKKQEEELKQKEKEDEEKARKLIEEQMKKKREEEERKRKELEEKRRKGAEAAESSIAGAQRDADSARKSAEITAQTVSYFIDDEILSFDFDIGEIKDKIDAECEREKQKAEEQGYDAETAEKMASDRRNELIKEFIQETSKTPENNKNIQQELSVLSQIVAGEDFLEPGNLKLIETTAQECRVKVEEEMKNVGVTEQEQKNAGEQAENLARYHAIKEFTEAAKTVTIKKAKEKGIDDENAKKLGDIAALNAKERAIKYNKKKDDEELRKQVEKFFENEERKSLIEDTVQETRNNAINEAKEKGFNEEKQKEIGDRVASETKQKLEEEFELEDQIAEMFSFAEDQKQKEIEKSDKNLTPEEREKIAEIAKNKAKEEFIERLANLAKARAMKESKQKGLDEEQTKKNGEEAKERKKRDLEEKKLKRPFQAIVLKDQCERYFNRMQNTPLAKAEKIYNSQINSIPQKICEENVKNEVKKAVFDDEKKEKENETVAEKKIREFGEVDDPEKKAERINKEFFRRKQIENSDPKNVEKIIEEAAKEARKDAEDDAKTRGLDQDSQKILGEIASNEMKKKLTNFAENLHKKVDPLKVANEGKTREKEAKEIKAAEAKKKAEAAKEKMKQKMIQDLIKEEKIRAVIESRKKLEEETKQKELEEEKRKSEEEIAKKESESDEKNKKENEETKINSEEQRKEKLLDEETNEKELEEGIKEKLLEEESKEKELDDEKKKENKNESEESKKKDEEEIKQLGLDEEKKKEVEESSKKDDEEKHKLLLEENKKEVDSKRNSEEDKKQTDENEKKSEEEIKQSEEKKKSEEIKQNQKESLEQKDFVSENKESNENSNKQVEEKKENKDQIEETKLGKEENKVSDSISKSEEKEENKQKNESDEQNNKESESLNNKQNEINKDAENVSNENENQTNISDQNKETEDKNNNSLDDTKQKETEEQKKSLEETQNNKENEEKKSSDNQNIKENEINQNNSSENNANQSETKQENRTEESIKSEKDLSQQKEELRNNESNQKEKETKSSSEKQNNETIKSEKELGQNNKESKQENESVKNNNFQENQNETKSENSNNEENQKEESNKDTVNQTNQNEDSVKSEKDLTNQNNESVKSNKDITKQNEDLQSKSENQNNETVKSEKDLGKQSQTNQNEDKENIQNKDSVKSEKDLGKQKETENQINKETDKSQEKSKSENQSNESVKSNKDLINNSESQTNQNKESVKSDKNLGKQTEEFQTNQSNESVKSDKDFGKQKEESETNQNKESVKSDKDHEKQKVESETNQNNQNKETVKNQKEETTKTDKPSTKESVKNSQDEAKKAAEEMKKKLDDEIKKKTEEKSNLGKNPDYEYTLHRGEIDGNNNQYPVQEPSDPNNKSRRRHPNEEKLELAGQLNSEETFSSVAPLKTPKLKHFDDNAVYKVNDYEEEEENNQFDNLNGLQKPSATVAIRKIRPSKNNSRRRRRVHLSDSEKQKLRNNPNSIKGVHLIHKTIKKPLQNNSKLNEKILNVEDYDYEDTKAFPKPNIDYKSMTPQSLILSPPLSPSAIRFVEEEFSEIPETPPASLMSPTNKDFIISARRRLRRNLLLKIKIKGMEKSLAKYEADIQSLHDQYALIAFEQKLERERLRIDAATISLTLTALDSKPLTHSIGTDPIRNTEDLDRVKESIETKKDEINNFSQFTEKHEMLNKIRKDSKTQELELKRRQNEELDTTIKSLEEEIAKRKGDISDEELKRQELLKAIDENYSKQRTEISDLDKKIEESNQILNHLATKVNDHRWILDSKTKELAQERIKCKPDVPKLYREFENNKKLKKQEEDKLRKLLSEDENLSRTLSEWKLRYGPAARKQLENEVKELQKELKDANCPPDFNIDLKEIENLQTQFQREIRSLDKDIARTRYEIEALKRGMSQQLRAQVPQYVRTSQ